LRNLLDENPENLEDFEKLLPWLEWRDFPRAREDKVGFFNVEADLTSQCLKHMKNALLSCSV
jgi:hypothetical protein